MQQGGLCERTFMQLIYYIVDNMNWCMQHKPFYFHNLTYFWAKHHNIKNFLVLFLICCEMLIVGTGYWSGYYIMEQR